MFYRSVHRCTACGMYELIKKSLTLWCTCMSTHIQMFLLIGLAFVALVYFAYVTYTEKNIKEE